MKVEPMDLGVCGIEQMMYAGTVAFDTEDVDKGVELCELPAGIVVTKAVAVVTEAFDAGTTNVLTVGANDDVNDLMGSGDITEGTKGAYSVNKFAQYDTAATIKAKYTQTGTDATAGAADIYLLVVRIPV